ncbi:MAG: DUF4837 family protein [Bacteroidetes bacterium]|nr:DUF4837 family protein [Bacteroidota bacterium]
MFNMFLLNRIHSAFYILPLVFALYACDGEHATKTLPESAGDLGGVLVVMDEVKWNGAVGDAIRDELSVPLYGSPQAEQEFNFKHVKRNKFNGLLMRYKSIVFLDDSNDGSKNSIAFKNDVWAKDQVVIQLKDMDGEDMRTLLKENKYKILDALKKNEIRGLQRIQNMALSKEMKALLPRKFGITLKVTEGFKIARDTTNFLWLRAERQRMKGSITHQISLGILIYNYPFTNIDNIKSQLIASKDSITKLYIHGSSENSYMKVYPDYEPSIREILYNGNTAFEIRGLWKMENDFMGGPFLTYVIADEEQKMVTVLDAYVYAPEFDKKAFLLELEAILKTMKSNS